MARDFTRASNGQAFDVPPDQISAIEKMLSKAQPGTALHTSLTAMLESAQNNANLKSPSHLIPIDQVEGTGLIPIDQVETGPLIPVDQVEGARDQGKGSVLAGGERPFDFASNEDPGAFLSQFSPEQRSAAISYAGATGVAAARGLASGASFGLSERFIPEDMKAKLAALPHMPFAEELANLYGGIKAIGAIQQGIGRLFAFSAAAAKGSGAAARLGRLAGEIIDGKASPRIAAAVQLGLASGVATGITDAIDPADNETLRDMAVSAAAGGLLGTVSVPTFKGQLKGTLAYGALNQATRGAIVGLPIVALNQGQTSSPFRVTGNAYIDQFLFDFGVQLLLTPRPFERGARFPVMTDKGVMAGTILDVEHKPDGRRVPIMQLENGMIRAYNIGAGPIILSSPPPTKPTPIPVKGGMLQNGALAVYTPTPRTTGAGQVGGKQVLVKFQGLSPDRSAMILGVVEGRGQQPTAHVAVPVKEVRKLAILDPKAIDELFPPLAQQPPPVERRTQLTPDLVAQGVEKERRAVEARKIEEQVADATRRATAVAEDQKAMQDIAQPEHMPGLLAALTAQVGKIPASPSAIATANETRKSLTFDTALEGRSAQDVVDIAGQRILFNRNLGIPAKPADEAILRRATIKAIERLPAPLRAQIHEVAIAITDANEGAYASYEAKPKRVTINPAYIGAAASKQGFTLKGFDALMRTIVHESAHGLSEANMPTADYEASIGQLGWTLAGHTPIQLLREDNGFIKNVGDGHVGTTQDEPNKWKVFAYDPEAKKMWMRDLTQHEEMTGTVDPRRYVPWEDLTHAVDEYVFNSDVLYAREPQRWQVVHDRVGSSLYGIGGFTTEGTGQIQMFNEPITAPTGERLVAGQERAAIQKNTEIRTALGQRLYEELFGTTKQRGKQDIAAPDVKAGTPVRPLDRAGADPTEIIVMTGRTKQAGGTTYAQLHFINREGGERFAYWPLDELQGIDSRAYTLTTLAQERYGKTLLELDPNQAAELRAEIGPAARQDVIDPAAKFKAAFDEQEAALLAHEDPDAREAIAHGYSYDIDSEARRLGLNPEQPIFPGSEITLGQAAQIAGTYQAVIREKNPHPAQVEKRIKQRLRDLSKLSDFKAEPIAAGLSPEKAEAATVAAEQTGKSVEKEQPLVAAPSGEAPKPGARRAATSVLDKVFSPILAKGEHGQQQIAEEMATMSDPQKFAVSRYFGIDGSGRPVGPPQNIADIARSMNMTPQEVGKLFEKYIRMPDGRLKITAGKNSEFRALPDGQRVFAFVTGNDFAKEWNQMKANIAAEQRTASNLADAARDATIAKRALDADPLNAQKQAAFRKTLARLNGLTNPQEPTTANAGDPVLPFLEAPPPKQLAPWLRQFKTDNLLKEWKKARLAQLANKADEKNNERVSQLTAEINRRGLTFPDTLFPAPAAAGGGKTPPPEKPPSDPAPPADGSKAWKQGDLKIRVVRDTTPEGQLEAIKHRDLTPKMVLIEDAATGDMVGQWRLWNIRPDFAENPRYAVTPGPKAGAFTVTDLKTGQSLGNFSRGGVIQLLGRDYRTHVNYDPVTGQAMPNAAAVAIDQGGTPQARMGTPMLSRGEYSNLTGEEQMAHVRNLIMAHATSKEQAWGFYKDYLTVNGLKEYDGRPSDQSRLLDELHKKWGGPPSSTLLPSDTLQALSKIKETQQRLRNEALSSYYSFYPRELGGTGEAYNMRIDAAAYQGLVEELFEKPVEPKDPWFEGRMLQGANTYSPVVRQMIYYGHPIMKDAYVKARGADAQSAMLTQAWQKKYDDIMGDLKVQDKLAIALWADGRYQQHAKVNVSKRALVSREAAFANTRKAVNSIFTAFTGRPTTVEMMVSDMTPELEAKARQFRGLLDDVAEMLQLTPGLRIDQYYPHVYTKVKLPGGHEVLNFYADQNLPREVFFRFGLPRRTTAPDYELNPDDVFDVYMRGAVRKIAYAPLLKEFSKPEILSHMSRDQQRYTKEWLKYLIGAPDPADDRMLGYLHALGAEMQPGASTTWLRRFVWQSQQPFTALSNAIRGQQFAAKIDYNFATAAVNSVQSWVTTVERHGLTGYFKALKDRVSDGEMQKAFIDSGLATEYMRADYGASALHKPILNVIRKLGRKAFAGAERMNRGIAFRSGYAAAAEAGMTGVDRVVAGILESDVTQFNMTRSGRLPMVRGDLGSVLFQFAPYRWEMLAHLGGEMSRVAHATATGDRQQAYLGFKRLVRAGVALQLIGGLDATPLGTVLRYMSDNDDPEWEGALGYIDKVSADYILGTMATGRPFEWGHRINPITLLNQRLLGPALSDALALPARMMGVPGSPTMGQTLVRQLPGGVQAERTLGPELQQVLTEPLFGRKEGKLRSVKRPPFKPESDLETILQGIGGPPPPKGSKSRG